MRPRRWTAGIVVAGALTGGSLFGAVAQPPGGVAGVTVRISPAVKARLVSHSGPVGTAQCEKAFGIACYEPAQIQAAYDEQPLFSRGFTGAGQSIAVIDAFGSPTIAGDLATFDETFGLPAPPSLTVVQPAGKVPSFNPNSPEMVGWATETTLDVEWAHVMAPGAAIVLLETPVAETEGSAGFKQIVKAEDYVVDHHLAGIISESFSATEETFARLNAITPLRHGFVNAFHHNVTVLSSSGDTGATAPKNADGSVLFTDPVTTWPPSDPLVTGVGGTALHLDSAGSRTAPDSVWNEGSDPTVDNLFFGNSGPDALASGGGRSAIFGRPSFQDGVAGVVGSARGVPDISMSSSCDGAVNIYETLPGISHGWSVLCGTSESTPLFAGIVAIADQYAHRHLGLLNPALYAMSAAGSPGLSRVTTGSNTVSFQQNGQLYTVAGATASGGYNTATGLGTVDAAAFVPSLVSAAAGRPPHGPGKSRGLTSHPITPSGVDPALAGAGQGSGAASDSTNHPGQVGAGQSGAGLSAGRTAPGGSVQSAPDSNGVAGTAKAAVIAAGATRSPASSAAIAGPAPRADLTAAAPILPSDSPLGSAAGPPSVVGQCVPESEPGVEED